MDIASEKLLMLNELMKHYKTEDREWSLTKSVFKDRDSKLLYSTASVGFEIRHGDYTFENDCMHVIPFPKGFKTSKMEIGEVLAIEFPEVTMGMHMLDKLGLLNPVMGGVSVATDECVAFENVVRIADGQHLASDSPPVVTNLLFIDVDELHSVKELFDSYLSAFETSASLGHHHINTYLLEHVPALSLAIQLTCAIAIEIGSLCIFNTQKFAAHPQSEALERIVATFMAKDSYATAIEFWRIVAKFCGGDPTGLHMYMRVEGERMY